MKKTLSNHKEKIGFKELLIPGYHQINNIKMADDRRQNINDDQDELNQIAEPLLKKAIQKKARKQIKGRLDKWIDEKLCATNAADILKVYHQLLKDIRKEVDDDNKKKAKVMRNFESKFNAEMDSQILPIVTCIKNVLVNFQTLMHQEFHENVCFSLAQLEEKVRSHFATAKQAKTFVDHNIEKYITETISRAEDILTKIYKDHNDAVLKHEVKLYVDTCNQLPTKPYLDAVKLLTQSNLRPEFISMIHAELEPDRFPFFSSLSRKHENKEMTEGMKILRHAYLKIKNDLNVKISDDLELGQQSVKKYIRAGKQAYEVNINQQLLQDQARGVPKKEFSNFENKFRSESVKQLEKALESLAWKEPTAAHVGTLLHRIAKTTVDFRRVNDDFLNASRTIDTTQYDAIQDAAIHYKKLSHEDTSSLPQPRKQDKVPIQPHLIEPPMKEPEVRKPVESLQDPSSSNDGPMGFVRIKKPQIAAPHGTIQNPECTELQKPPHVQVTIDPPSSSFTLIIQMDMEKIGVSVFTSDKQLEFPFGTHSIEAKIGQTSESKWLIGPELQEASHTHNVFPLGLPDDPNQKFEIIGDKAGVTYELIFGIFVALVKKRVEQTLNDEIPRLVIILPMWVSIRQRQQLLASGKVAGFNNVHLLNESFILARFMLSEPAKHGTTAIAVISENSRKIDITIHTVNHQKLEVSRALVHTGNYSVDHSVASKHKLPAWRQRWNRILPNFEQWNAENAMFCFAWKSVHCKEEVTNLASGILTTESSSHLMKPDDQSKLIAKEVADLLSKGLLGTWRDGIPYSIMTSDRERVVKKEDTFHIPSKDTFEFKLSSPKKSLWLFEDTQHTRSCDIGEFHLQPRVIDRCHSATLFFKVTNEGIVDLPKVQIQNKSNKIENLNTDEYFWKSSSLNKKDEDMYAKRISQWMHSNG